MILAGAGTLSVTVGLSGGWPAPDVDNEPRIRDLKASRRAVAVASAQNATAEDRFAEVNRSVDISHGEKNVRE